MQYELFDKEIEDYYVDQAGRLGYVSSFYTSYGIKCFDSEYSNRIQNLFNPVIKLKAGHNWSGKDAKEIELTNYRSYTEMLFVTREVHGEYKYSYTYPKFLINGMEDPEVLRKDIKGNSHLHVKIKENLLQNLDREIANV